MWWRRSSLIVKSVLAINLAASLCICAPRDQTSDDGDQMVGVLARLASKREGSRRAAIAKIVNLGSAAIPSLMNRLRELETLETDIPCTDEVGKGDSRSEQGIPIMPCKELDRRLNLLSRLRSDLIVLLGRLHAFEAVPLLIELTALQESEGIRRYSGPELGALIEMGPPAVPKLIDAINEIEEDRSAPVRRFSATTTFRIESRVAVVLGEIRDVSALPVLRELQRRNADEYLTPYLDEAIKKLTSKSNHGLSR